MLLKTEWSSLQGHGNPRERERGGAEQGLQDMGGLGQRLMTRATGKSGLGQARAGLACMTTLFKASLPSLLPSSRKYLLSILASATEVGTKGCGQDKQVPCQVLMTEEGPC